MKGNLRRSMIWLHTYSGLFMGWLLFTIFVSGTLSYYSDEITQWMQPEQLEVTRYKQPVNAALTELNKKAQGAAKWQIQLGTAREPGDSIRWQMPGESRRQGHREPLIDSSNSTESSSEQLTPRETAGGRFFVHFHYALELRNWGGRYFTGFAAMIMLVACFSGIFTHRRFFQDFFTLRWKNLKRALTDSHAIIGIITLPFCFMICVSALLFYTYLYVPHSANIHYEKGYNELSSHISPSSYKRSESGEAAQPITNFAPIMEQVNQLWQGNHRITWITYQHPFDKNGYLTLYREKQLNLSRRTDTLTFDAQSGQLLHQNKIPRIPRLTADVFLGLHEAKFASPILRFGLFVLGSFCCVLIATGSILWLQKRLEANKMHAGIKVTTKLNKVFFGGMIFAVLCYFYANRLIPIETEHRDEWEIRAFLFSWLLFGLTTLIPAMINWWRNAFYAMAVLSFGLPIIDLLLPPHYLLKAVATTNLTYLSIHLSFIVTGLFCYKLASYCNKKKRELSAKGQQKKTEKRT
ncbi:MAG: PepSY-associated TM helix domain-containing protein [Parashewanella sp.]